MSMYEPMLAEVTLFGGNFEPVGWAFCEGQLLAIAQNQALYSILGTIYGGDGRTTFALPDLRGRAPIHKGTGPGLSTYEQGQRGGVESVTLTTPEMPAHTHTTRLKAAAGDANTALPTGHILGGAEIYSIEAPAKDLAHDAISVATTGGNLAHENRPPFLVMNYIIATQGIFPARR